MDVNSVLSNYNLASLWNTLSPSSSGSSTNTTTVPLVDNIDSTIKESQLTDKFNGKTTSSELQDIYSSLLNDNNLSSADNLMYSALSNYNSYINNLNTAGTSSSILNNTSVDLYKAVSGLGTTNPTLLDALA